ncbi:hypothetical protein DFH07DRAFT_961763 [Mycena maculata]|uniref:Ubinuclein middle domain-containing protein n=1 Tax=Mycena maculata TaxID=230809 RepID=A0AAD7N835_9AGAR|nr:hypothetical protein DFH07DRAFT_961763 [Mycena maculata]
MDSDVEMIEAVGTLAQSPAPSATSSHRAHVSPAPSRSRSVIDDLDEYGNPSKGKLDPEGGNGGGDGLPDVGDGAEPPPTSNDDDGDAPMDGEAPISPNGADGEEHDDDEDSENENSSDDASEDDVDKDLIPDGDATDAEESKPVAADAMAIVVDNAENPGGIRIPVLVDPIPSGAAPPTSPLSAPPTSAAKPAPKKPKSHHAPPPPPPPAPPPPMQTIRLEIKLGGPDNYEVDVKGKAREEGFVWGERVGKKYADEDSGSEGDSDGEGEEKDAKDKEKEKDGKDADGDVEMDADGKPKPKKPKPKKKAKGAGEYYDVTDPFIDDSELAIDERTYFAQTKQKGFYVSSGEVALVRDKSPKKPKSKKKAGPALSLALPTASTSALKPASTALKKSKSAGAPTSKAKAKALGTKESPIALEDEDEDKADVFGTRKGSVKGKEKAEDGDMGGDGDDGASADGKGKWKERVSVNGEVKSEDGDEEVGQKRKRAPNGTSEGGKKRKVVDVANFHPDLQASIEDLKQAIAKESWETKSKFPPNLKPRLAALSLQAITLDEYNEEFFNLMPNIFPYNKFTMQKLIKRTIFADHTALLNQRQDDLLETLRVLASEGFPRAQEEWERNLQNYEEKRKAKADDGDPGPSVEGSRHGTEDPEARVGSQGLSSAGDDKDKTNGANGKAGDEKDGPGKGGAHPGPPLKKYRMTDAMKSAVWELVLLSNEICRLENEKNSLEGSVLQVSEQGLRKSLYQRIVAAFPEGWMSSGQISRDVSAMKKKHEKEALDD